MVNATRKDYELNIELSTPEILMMGHSSESAGKSLQGTVILKLTKSMKIRSIVLTFIGKVKVAWFEGSGHHQCNRSEEKELVRGRQQFLPIMNQKNKKTFILGPGEHKWNFELALPGNLPQSVKTESGEIVYLLKATVERPAFLHNLIKKMPVQVLRCLLPSEFELNQSMVVCNTWPRKMSYNITLPSKVFSRGQTLCTAFSIRPITSKLEICSITCTLKEYSTFTAQGFTKTDSRIIEQNCKNHPFLRANSRTEWVTVVSLDIPSMASQFAFCDADCGLIRIRHKIKISISLKNDDGHLSELRCSIPVIIMTANPEQFDQTLLPAYDQAWRSVLYLEESSPTSSDSEDNNHPTMRSHHSYQPQISSTDDEQSIWWHGVNLCRVPSYRTASRELQHFNLSSSLPSYDQLYIS